MDDSPGTDEPRAAAWTLRPPDGPGGERAAFSQLCLQDSVIVDLAGGPAAPDAGMVLADPVHLPFAPGRLGRARGSYLDLPRPDLPAALAQLHQALALGAPIELTVPAGAGEWLADVVHGAGFDIGEPAALDHAWVVVRAERARTLPDFVGPAMAVLVCGLNPSVVAADAGFGYAAATNRFWRAAVSAGLISPQHARRPLLALAQDHVGMTDLVKRATPRAAELTPADYRTGAARVRRLVSWLRPGLVLFVGLAGWRAAVDRTARPGVQPLPFGGVPAYVMPSTSGLNAATTMAQLVAHLEAAARHAAR